MPAKYEPERALELCELARYGEAESLLRGASVDDPAVLLARGAVEFERNLEKAKDLFSRSARIFGGDPYAVRALAGLAMAYFMAGELNEAEIAIQTALDHPNQTQRYCPLMANAIIQTERGRLHSAMEILSEAVGLSLAPVRLGRVRNQQAIILQRQSEKVGATQAAIKRDQAILKLDEAYILFEQCGAYPLVGRVITNMVRLFLPSKQFSKAHSYIDRGILVVKSDRAHLGKFYDERAVVYLEQRANADATRAAREAVRLLENTGRNGWLCEALVTLGTSLARTGADEDARSALESAVRLATQLGNEHDAGIAIAALLAEVPMSCSEGFALYSQVSEPRALVAAGRGLQRVVEAERIRTALLNNNGSVTEAARELDLTQPGLAHKLKTQFRELLPLRKKPQPRTKRRRVLSSSKK